MSEKFILWFDQIGIEDVPIVGGKNASLGEMYRHLTSKGVNVPNGFAITSHAYRYVLEKGGILGPLQEALKNLDIHDSSNLAKAGQKARDLILGCTFPKELEEAILEAYRNLGSLDVAVRSSATAEDLPTASFAGQQESFLNISSPHELLEATKKCFASLFTNRAIVYRVENKFDHFKTYLSVAVQKMVRSDLSSAGVMFTLDTESGFSDVVFVTGSFGLGESVVQGSVNPDEFYVFKPTLKLGFKSLIEKKLGEKQTKIIYSSEGYHPIKKIETPLDERKRFCLSDEEVLTLARWAVIVEDHYSQKNGKWMPMDLEWAKDGKTNELFIVQARPETVQSQRNRNVIEEYKLSQKGQVLVKGKSVGSKIATGKAHVIHDVKDIAQFKKGEVLITDMTDPDWVPIMRIASAIVTNRGGRTSHAAIVSRELGLPCIVGTNNATEVIKTDQEITISCAEGDEGVVYQGILPFTIDKIDVEGALQPKTKIMINVGTPEGAFEQSFLPNDGVGLAREEFIVSEHIKIHPMALVQFDKVKDEGVRKQIDALTAGFNSKEEFFIDKLASGIAIIAAAFYPKDVILRFSDFKTNEYVNLIGGKYFEPKEENPMLGWRGASRYYMEGYKEGFALECKAVKKVRESFGLINLKVMIPVCRTPDEGRKVLAVMADNGLKQGHEGLEVYVMCEIPSNVIAADLFCDIFDGFSIGSNDLTQLTLGVDRDSSLVASIYDERNIAVKRMIEHVIKIAKERNKKIGICGDGPSTYPDFATFLVDCGIDSMSLSPDAVIKMRTVIANYEAVRVALK